MSTNDPNSGPGGSGMGVIGPTGSVSGVNTAGGVPSKISHVKATPLDSGSSALVGGITIGGVSAGGSTMLPSGVSSTGTIKVAPGGTVSNSIVTPIGMSTSQTPTAIRAIGTSGQSTQVRVVVPNAIMPPTMIKQFESAATGRTQITAIPPATSRTNSNTSITVTRPGAQTTYLPRASVTATQITGMGVASGQRLITPIRTAPVSGATGSNVTGLTTGGSFVRGTAVSRNTNSPATTVISPATSTTWMAANNSGQVQLIRTIPHQPRQRILTTQGITSASLGAGVSASGALVGNTATVAPTSVGHLHGQQNQSTPSNIQTVQPQVAPHSQQQQTYVATLATVLPPRQHQATLVYSNSQPPLQPQQYSPSVATGQRFAVANNLTATTATAQRQVRPIPLGKSFSTTKLNTTSISIRPPNLPQLTPAIGTGITGNNVPTATAASNSPRSSTVTGVTGTAASVIPTTNLSTTRIIQLQQPQGATQQIIGPTGRLAGNVMLQPIIVNASNSAKIGLRPSVSMAAKSQPSLTITQLGIGKLPSSGTGNSVSQQNVTANIQAIGNSGSASPSTSTSSVSAANLSAGASTQLVNVSQAQLLSTQNICSSAQAVMPLAITARGQSAGGLLSGAIPLKNANAITVGKIMTQAQVSVANNDASLPTGITTWHAAASQTRGTHGGNSVSVAVSSTVPSSSIMTASNAVLSSTGTSTASNFLPPGSTIYYESVPASSVQVSTGVLSLTTTTATSTTMSQNQIGNSAPNLGISALPFVSHPPNSTATFTVVPTSSGRNIGQLQIPVSSSNSQLQSVPVRFNAVTHSTSEALSVSQTATQLLQNAITSTGPQIIIPNTHTGPTPGTISAQTAQHMVIPLQTSIKVTSGGNAGSAVVSNFLRKRDADGSPIRAAKNLGPTLLSMSSNVTSAISPIVSSACNTLSVTPATSTTNTSALTAEALAKKDRNNVRSTRAESPASSDGSTTVSANSSPGVEQQMQDGNILLNRMPTTSDSTHFNPINDLYSNHHSVINQNNAPTTPASSRNSSVDQPQTIATSVPRINGNAEIQQRKKLRRSTNDSQLSTQSQASLSLPPPTATAPVSNSSATTDGNAGITTTNGTLESAASYEDNITINNNHKTNNMAPTTGNKENTKPVEYILRRPRNCTLLHTYKQTWKSANNHFQRYSDVKPREERRPTVIDLANQSNVQGKINGWKIHHLRSQMEDLCENESLGYEKLSEMLQQMETHNKNPELERINELLKGNIQRNKIIVDGLNDAQSQIMKIFEHKSHVSDIINRCASKRNFKKREKV